MVSDPVFKQAKEKLVRISEDPDAKELIRQRERAELNWASTISEAKEEGFEEGRDSGLKEGLDKGLKEGLDKGLKEGLDKGLREAAARMLTAGMSRSEIAQLLGMAEDTLFTS